MDSSKNMTLLIKLFLLDILGLTLVGLGIAKLQVNVDFLPQALRFAHYGWVFVMLGVMLMLPLVVHVIRFTLKKPE